MYTPPGFGTVTPYLFINNADEFISFLKLAFGGIEIGRTLMPNGKIANAQIKIGTTTIMLSEASEKYKQTFSSFYLYVEDAKLSIQNAIYAGAKLEMPISEMPYGDLQGGVVDPFGNLWWISQRIIKKPYFEKQ